MGGIPGTFHMRFPNGKSCGVWVGGGGGQAGFLCFSPKWASSVTGSLPKDSQGN